VPSKLEIRRSVSARVHVDDFAHPALHYSISIHNTTVSMLRLFKTIFAFLALVVVAMAEVR
jgi:hypothetical protein